MSDPAVHVRGLHKSYRMGRTDLHVLRGVSFEAREGEFVAIVGASGSGKSTLLHLVGLLDRPDKGRLALSGIDAGTLSASRRNRIRCRDIGFVFQDCFLFNDTVMANIRYAAPGASDEAVMEASRRAYADEFIEKMPNGYMSVIGEGGTQLSQGEKRRLMIARVILKNPRILILDEPLVSLDADARQRAIEGLGTLMKDRTVLTITHYPAELPYADKQLHVSDGKVTVRELTGKVLKP